MNPLWLQFRATDVNISCIVDTLALDESRQLKRECNAPVIRTPIASGVSMFCDNDNNAKVRALFDIYGNEDDSIAEQDARSFFNTAFKVL